MCQQLKEARNYGSRKTLVIVCEGAIDAQLNPIKPDYVKKVIETRLSLDTRVTTLGHVQRGFLFVNSEVRPVQVIES